MGKTRKQVLAEFLMSRDEKRWSAKVISDYSDEHGLGVQAKTLNSNGDFVIKFSSSDPWVKPSEWLHNYQVSIKERYEEAASIYHSLFPQENSDEEIAEDDSIVGDGFDETVFDAWLRAMTDDRFYILDGELIFGGQGAIDSTSQVLQRFTKMKNPESIIRFAIGDALIECGACEQSIMEMINEECSRRTSTQDQS